MPGFALSPDDALRLYLLKGVVWDEALHPRGELGRFVGAGSSVGLSGSKEGRKKDGGRLTVTANQPIPASVVARVLPGHDLAEIASDIVQDTAGDLSVRWVASETGDALRMIISDPANEKEGLWISQTFIRTPSGELNVNLAVFEVPKEAQGHDLAKHVMEHAYETYHDLHVKHVDLEANLDVGGYAWAKFGFKATEPGRLADLLDVQAEVGDRVAGVTKAERDQLRAVIAQHHDDPSLPWHVAGTVTADGRKIGKELMLGSSWNGQLVMHDPEATGRLTAYVKTVTPPKKKLTARVPAVSLTDRPARPREDDFTAQPKHTALYSVDADGHMVDAWIWDELLGDDEIEEGQYRHVVGESALTYRAKLALLLGDAPGHPFRGNQYTDGSGAGEGHSFGRSEKVHAVVRDALDEMGDRQAEPREHHIGIDAETGERLFDVVGDAGGSEGALAQGLANPTLDDLRPSAGVVPYGKIHDKHVIDIHTHPKTKGGAFSGEDLGLLTGSHIDTMLVVDDDSIGVLNKTDAFRQHQEAAWKRDTNEKTPAADRRPWYPRRVRDRYNEVLDEMTTPDKAWEVNQVLHDALKQVAAEMGVEFSVMPRKKKLAYRAKLALLLGDAPGHPFRGNQWATGDGKFEKARDSGSGGGTRYTPPPKRVASDSPIAAAFRNGLDEAQGYSDTRFILPDGTRLTHHAESHWDAADSVGVNLYDALTEGIVRVSKGGAGGFEVGGRITDAQAQHIVDSTHYHNESPYIDVYRGRTRSARQFDFERTTADEVRKWVNDHFPADEPKKLTDDDKAVLWLTQPPDRAFRLYGTTEGVLKGWETRRHGGGAPALGPLASKLSDTLKSVTDIRDVRFILPDGTRLTHQKHTHWEAAWDSGVNLYEAMQEGVIRMSPGGGAEIGAPINEHQADLLIDAGLSDKEKLLYVDLYLPDPKTGISNWDASNTKKFDVERDSADTVRQWVNRHFQKLTADQMAALLLGDFEGHPFRGNQWTGGMGNTPGRGVVWDTVNDHPADWARGRGSQRGTKADGELLNVYNLTPISDKLRTRVLGDLDPANLASQIVEDIPGRLSVAWKPIKVYGDLPALHMQVTRADGLNVEYHFVRQRNGALVVEQHKVEVPAESQGQDLAKYLMESSYRVYDGMGVKRVDLYANLDQGGYAWARFGFKDNNPQRTADRLTTILTTPQQATIEKQMPKLTVAERADLVAKVEKYKNDPRLPWYIAGSTLENGTKVGQAMLNLAGWSASMDMNDKEARARMTMYAGKKKPKKPKAPD